MTTETPFPHDVLTPLPNERPTVATLRLLNQEITTNAISVYSTGGNGLLGHYALVANNATYLAASNNVPFVAPVHPGQNPVHLAGATSAQITETNRRHAADLVEFNTYRKTDASLKKQLLAAVPGTYINRLKHQQLGFANITTLAILEHLQTTYGTLTIDELTANVQKMNKPWSPNEAIETLFEQIRECQVFAAATDPISDRMALRAALDNVEKSGVFGDAVRDFRKLAEVDKTYNRFVTTFNQADSERLRLLTTQAAGYHSASTAISINNHQALAASTTGTKPESIKEIYYCWTHGVGFNHEHTSATCKAPQSGHRSEATVTNMLGGNNFVRRQRNEKQVYVAPSRTKQANKAIASNPDDN